MKHALDSFFESLSDADSDSTILGPYGIDSGMHQRDAGHNSSGRQFAKSSKPLTASERKTKAVLYARVSSDHQKKEGTIESQVATLRRQIAQAGHELVREYIDDGYTGTLLSRPGLEQLRCDLKTDLFDTVHFLAADRIARDVAYQTIIVGELIKHGKQIIINGVDYRDNPENKVTLTILGAVAEFERAKIIERMVRGKVHRLRKGEMIGALAPFGYEHVKKTATTLAIKEPEAGTVREVFGDAARRGNTEAATGSCDARMPTAHPEAASSCLLVIDVLIVRFLS